MQDLDEMNIEIMRNTLYKACLDDYAQSTLNPSPPPKPSHTGP